MAKFEVCCHKFADLSEHNYGVSIINDSKYGFSTAGKAMRLSLLRSSKAPDGNADMGSHHIRWAIMPHRGGLGTQTVRAAFNFNNPMRLVAGKPAKFPVKLNGDDNLVLDWVKRGENDEDISLDALPTKKERTVVVRVYDALGGMGRGTIETAYAVEKVYKTNILEDDLEEIAVQNDAFNIEVGPFEVATYRLVLNE